ncbi:hypothetical protein JKG68_25375 [Microvirga aerilata]|uniref:Uncharacterized protein n=1 Tax=Microvirga aerilata TaxID=670292 RepID=A0A936ZHF6_9HYPH|nr:hypothetical protein [Microvirga aerilata]MBL0407262.1 hypothetical protein [Microvirga aerilata]
MGEWKTVFDAEVEGRPVVVKVYDSDDESEAGERAVRVTTMPIGDGASALERNEQTPLSGPAEAGSIILDPAIFDDLEEELIEVGFSPEAAARIASTVPR